jgi:hypothetical protein
MSTQVVLQPQALVGHQLAIATPTFPLAMTPRTTSSSPPVKAILGSFHPCSLPLILFKVMAEVASSLEPPNSGVPPKLVIQSCGVPILIPRRSPRRQDLLDLSQLWAYHTGFGMDSTPPINT